MAQCPFMRKKSGKTSVGSSALKFVQLQDSSHHLILSHNLRYCCYGNPK
jgi:hypothetical protein